MVEHLKWNCNGGTVILEWDDGTVLVEHLKQNSDGGKVMVEQ